jgi:hypothetical protein
MVRFSSITIYFTNGSLCEFRSLEEFEEYRRQSAKALPESEKNRYEVLWNNQRNTEVSLEHKHELPDTCLKGISLLFGTVEKAAEKLTAYEARQVFQNRFTKVKIKVLESERKVKVAIFSGCPSWAPASFTYSYPIGELLMPRFEPMQSSSDDE